MYVAAPSDVTIPTSENCSPSSSESYVIGKKKTCLHLHNILADGDVALQRFVHHSKDVRGGRVVDPAVKCDFPKSEAMAAPRHGNFITPSTAQRVQGQATSCTAALLISPLTQQNSKHERMSRALSQNEHQALHHSYADSAHLGTKTNVMSTHTERCLAASLVKDGKHNANSS